MNEQTQQLKNTPCHIAARHGHFLIVKYLAEAGANITLTNKDGQTAFDFAEDSKRQIELQLANSKNKIGGPGFDYGKVQITLENLDAIKRMLAKSAEGGM
jgi:ankyrin repeat protein